ncbi:MAG: DUF4037 domain-containing protein [Lachnospiraceae bacterium]|nr:DUF4037 domain-containing protein [Lachnospiraceae bacterium]
MKRRLEQLLNELNRMEDLEENLQMVPLYEEALKLSEDIYGAYNLKTLEICNNYGGHLRNLGLYDKAEQVLRKAIDCAKTVRGTTHPDYATSLVNLANLLRMMKCYEESEELFLQALGIYEKTIGNRHFLYAGTGNNLGLLYRETSRYDKAMECFRRSLAILEGQDAYRIPYAITLHNMVDLYKIQGMKEEAERILKKEIGIYKEMKYEGTVLYAAALNSLGILYYEKGQYAKAYEAMQESVEIAREHLGLESESYQNGSKNLAMIAEKLGGMKPYEAAAANAALEEEKPVVKGMDICRAYFYEVCYPVLEREFKTYLPRMAAGMVGEGSECYGFDDEISRDHDFGPSFQIYIPKEDMPIYGERLKMRLKRLPKTFKEFGMRTECEYGGGRTGVFAIEDFYRKFIAVENVPESTNIWRQIPEHALSTVTNGEVFFDNYGRFSGIREELKKGYPEDVRLKKISARLMKMAQSGQYNFPRCLKRREYAAAHLALSEFMSVAMSLVYLLNHAYRPYYKWVHRGLLGLPILGEKIYDKMNQLATLPVKTEGRQMEWLVEEICNLCLLELKNQGLTSNPEKFLLMQGPEVLKRIKDPALKNSSPWVE